MLFRAAPFLALALFLAALEGALRLGDYGHSGEYLRVRDIGGAPHYTGDRDYFRAFFPPNLLPSIEPMAVSVRKTEKTVRIAVLGESAALGTPDPAFGFPRILERMLAHRHPDLRFEVINASATAINSHVLADLAPRLARLEPDLLVVYAGNNEMVGPFGPGTVFAPFLADIRLVKAGIFLGRTRTGQLVLDLSRKLSWQAKPPERWAGLGMFKERSIAPGAPCLRPAYEHYRKNLDQITAAGRSMGAQVILATMASNLRDFGPLSSVPSEGDSLGAAGHWRLGQSLLRQGRDKEAAAELLAARDLDALRFRADSPINAAIREAASAAAAPATSPAVRLADVEAAFRAAAPHGIPGREFFHEHVHFTFAGNHVVAKTLVPSIDAALLSSGRIAALPADEPLDEEVCRRELGLTGWHRLGMAEKIEGLLSKPPFINRPSGEEEVRLAREDREALAGYGDPSRTAEVVEELRQALEIHPQDPVLHRNHGEYLLALGLGPEAAAEFETVLSALPQDARTRQLLARTLASMGRLPEAAGQYRLALAAEPWLPELRNGLGNLLVRQGDTRGAIGQYHLAIQSQPNLPEVYFNLGRAYAEEENPREAARAYRQALDLDPGFQPAARALETQ